MDQRIQDFGMIEGDESETRFMKPNYIPIWNAHAHYSSDSGISRERQQRRSQM